MSRLGVHSDSQHEVILCRIANAKFANESIQDSFISILEDEHSSFVEEVLLAIGNTNVTILGVAYYSDYIL